MFEIVFENEFFVVIDKPSGLLSVPARKLDTRPSIKKCLENTGRFAGAYTAGMRAGGASDNARCVGDKVGHKSDIIHGMVLPVHRLDYEVSGLVLFAKTHPSQVQASFWFENRQIFKKYEAWTEGVPQKSWSISHTLEWNSKLLRGKKRAYESPIGKLALTKVIWTGPFEYHKQQAQSWDVFPQTGRPHQIRYEFFKHGYPVLGDTLYGSKINFLKSAIALRAVSLDFSKCENFQNFDLPLQIKCSSLKDYVATIS